MISTIVYILFLSALSCLFISVFSKKITAPLTSALLFLMSGIGSFMIEREYCENVVGWSCYTSTTVETSFAYVCGVLLVYSIVLTFIRYFDFQNQTA